MYLPSFSLKSLSLLLSLSVASSPNPTVSLVTSLDPLNPPVANAQTLWTFQYPSQVHGCCYTWLLSIFISLASPSLCSLQITHWHTQPLTCHLWHCVHKWSKSVRCSGEPLFGPMATDLVTSCGSPESLDLLSLLRLLVTLCLPASLCKDTSS